MDARISFSNEFVDTHHHHHNHKTSNNYMEAPVSSDFEFSVKDFTLIPADEIFFKGVMVPLKEDVLQGRKMTLREELMVDVDELPTTKMPKISGWWKEKLGLKRGNNNNNIHVGKRNDGMLLERIEEKIASSFVHDDTLSLGNSATREVPKLT
ncbi:hypothetical protein LINPERHAP1_LOCUS12463 [Linum perenne]